MPNFNVCGTIYPYPNIGDNPWGQPNIDWASAVSVCLTNLNTQVQTLVMPNVFTASGDIVYANPSVIPARLPIGPVGNILTVDTNNLPAWKASPIGSTVPIGTYLQWDDFNGTLTLDPNYRYADGTVINAPGSPLDGKTTKDMSGRYAVGYGTVGGADVGSAPWSSTPVGNTNNQINLSHFHTNAHVHTTPNHSHAAGSLQFLTSFWDQGAQHLVMYRTSGTGENVVQQTTYATPGAGAVKFMFNSLSADRQYATFPGGSGNTGSNNGGNTGASSSPNTSTNLSTVQSIQPDSNTLRWIVRVL